MSRGLHNVPEDGVPSSPPNSPARLPSGTSPYPNGTHLATASTSTFHANNSPTTPAPASDVAPSTVSQRKSVPKLSKRASQDNLRRSKGASSALNLVAAGQTQRIKHAPRIPHDSAASPAPPTLMYWSRAPVYGTLPMRNMRAHSLTMADDGVSAWVFGGCDDKECANDVYVFDVETMCWRHPSTSGDVPPPCRAHTATLVDRRLVVIGGGEGGTYYDSVYVLDTLTRKWTRPRIEGSTMIGKGTPQIPAPRRAHTAVYYQGRIWVFGGGNGVRALNDLWCLEVGSPPDSRGQSNPWRWHGPFATDGDIPSARGYHTANLIGKIMVVVGGSDGRECFGDVHYLNLETLVWTAVNLHRPYRRLSHTATQVGSYLFIFGGHDGVDYQNEILALNLVSLQYEPRHILGRQPTSRGYHAALLADARVYIIGGYNGSQAFDDVWTLDLAAGAYLPQVTSFVVDSQQ